MQVKISKVQSLRNKILFLPQTKFFYTLSAKNEVHFLYRVMKVKFISATLRKKVIFIKSSYTLSISNLYKPK